MKKLLYLIPLVFIIPIALVINQQYINTLQSSTQNLLLNRQSIVLQNKLSLTQKELVDLQNSDQILQNKLLNNQFNQQKSIFKSLVELYQRILNLKDNAIKVPKLESQWAEVLSFLAKGDPTSSAAKITALNNSIIKTETELATSTLPPTNLPVNNSPPASGVARQMVETTAGKFAIDIISADLRTTKVIVDTASDSNCQNNCPVMPLADYAKRRGAFAAINGPYFCPESYPACADKKNSFDTLLLNYNKTYFNSDNNVYSNNPVAVFSSTSRFVSQGQEWGRDTGVDSVIMSRPLLVFNNEVKFFGNNDTKETIRGNRSFIGASDSTVYIGVVRNATVAEVALVVAKLGIKNALNLDSGGSTAFWSNGKYLAGPGRNTPFGILLVRR